MARGPTDVGHRASISTGMHCLHCRTIAAPGEKRCSNCGARFNPFPWRRFVYLALLAATSIVFVVGVLGLWEAARSRGQAVAEQKLRPKPKPTTTIEPTTTTAAAVTTTVAASATTASTTPAVTTVAPSAIVAARVEASATARPGVDSCGQPVRYDAANVQDNDPTTAWRVARDGTGETLVLTLPSKRRVTEVGLIGGYAKVDPCAGIDRFRQLRRITNVTWVFDGGVKVPQSLRDDPQMQTTPVDAVTQTITLQIDATTSPGAIDATAISEVSVKGVPA